MAKRGRIVSGGEREYRWRRGAVRHSARHGCLAARRMAGRREGVGANVGAGGGLGCSRVEDDGGRSNREAG